VDLLKPEKDKLLLLREILGKIPGLKWQHRQADPGAESAETVKPAVVAEVPEAKEVAPAEKSAAAMTQPKETLTEETGSKGEEPAHSRWIPDRLL